MDFATLQRVLADFDVVFIGPPLARHWGIPSGAYTRYPWGWRLETLGDDWQLVTHEIRDPAVSPPVAPSHFP